jgi:hypothetical protein
MDGNMGDNGQYGYSPFQHHHTFHHSTPNLLQYPVPVMIGGYMGDQKTVCMQTPGDRMTDLKQRRFTPDQHVFLEGEFRADNKPTTAIKRGYASQLGVSLERINVSIVSRLALLLTISELVSKPSSQEEARGQKGQGRRRQPQLRRRCTGCVKRCAWPG